MAGDSTGEGFWSSVTGWVGDAYDASVNYVDNTFDNWFGDGWWDKTKTFGKKAIKDYAKDATARAPAGQSSGFAKAKSLQGGIDTRAPERYSSSVTKLKSLGFESSRLQEVVKRNMTSSNPSIMSAYQKTANRVQSEFRPTLPVSAREDIPPPTPRPRPRRQTKVI